MCKKSTNKQASMCKANHIEWLAAWNIAAAIIKIKNGFILFD